MTVVDTRACWALGAWWGGFQSCRQAAPRGVRGTEMLSTPPFLRREAEGMGERGGEAQPLG